MRLCPRCGHEHPNNLKKCPECGHYYSKIIELIDEEQALELSQSFRGRCERILHAQDKKQAINKELRTFYDGLSKTAVFTLAVIFLFIFALVVSVL